MVEFEPNSISCFECCLIDDFPCDKYGFCPNDEDYPVFVKRSNL